MWDDGSPETATMLSTLRRKVGRPRAPSRILNTGEWTGNMLGDRLSEVADHLRKSMSLQQPVVLEFVGGVGVNYRTGVAFREPDADAGSNAGLG
jgi:hypothetical protein